MTFAREDAEGLLRELSEELLKRTMIEPITPPRIIYFDGHRVVEVKFYLWRKYISGKEYAVSYMWTLYLRTQKIRYGIAVSCASVKASERTLVKLLGEETIRSLMERGFSVMRLDRRVILGKEMALDAFGESQKEESLNLMLDVQPTLVTNISTFEESLCFDGSSNSLIRVLKEITARYGDEWENNGKPLIDNAREEIIKFAKGESDELNLPSKGEAGRLLWFVAGGVSDRGDPDGLRKFLKSLIEMPSENAIQLVREHSNKIRGASMLGLINLAALVYPETIMPIWGSPKDTRGILNPVSSRILGITKPASKFTIKEYSELAERIRLASKEAGISNLWEAAFYLIKMSREPISLGYNAYMEITKPTGKIYTENHVGRFLWSPADAKYWNGRYGKIGLLKVGDIVLHDVHGKIVGYSVVAEPPKELTKEKVIELFEKIGIWNEKYKEFAEGWFSKSKNGKFYVVKLGNFRKLNKPLKYSEVKGLPSPGGLEGVYLIDIPPEVLKNLKIVQRGTDTRVVKLDEYFASKGYLYPSYLVSQFYTALKTKGFVILSGLTGTGKTKIAQELAKLLDDSENNFLFLPVRPDWRDSKALLGYYNPLNEKYHKTDLLEFILKAVKDYEDNWNEAVPYFVLLDEMNLAHVEYYFADFLSVLESGRDEDGFTREPLRLHDVDKVKKEDKIPKEIYLPPNLYIIGTVNMDETTYAFSPKVLDRAFVVEFHDVGLEGYPPETGEPLLKTIESLGQTVLKDLRGSNGKFLARSKDEINKAVIDFKSEHPDYWSILVNFNKALEPYDMHFGYRVVDEIALFFKNAKESEEAGIVKFEGDDEIFDLALLMKVLPKFHGNRKRLEKPLKEVLRLCLVEDSGLKVDELRSADIVEILGDWENKQENFRFKHTARKVLRMLRQLYEIGFASFS